MIHSFIERLNNIGYDIQLRTYVLTLEEKPELPVAIIDIDDRSLEAEGRWPWPRSKLAQLTDELQKQGASVIAYDIFFSETEPNIANQVLDALSKEDRLTIDFTNELKKAIPLFDNDTIFADSLADKQVVLALGFLPRPQEQNILPRPMLTLAAEELGQIDIYRAKGYISNIPILMKAAKTAGFINIFADIDGIIRHAPLVIEYKGNLYPSLALQAVMKVLGQKVELIMPRYGTERKLEGVRIGSTVIPTDARGQVLIPFIGKSYTFPYFSATDVLQHKLPKDALLGKILFVGTSATGLGDLQSTAIQNPFPGVEIQATLANGILTNDFSYKPAWTLGANIVLTVLFGMICSVLFAYVGPRTLGFIIISLPPLLLFTNNIIWKETGLVLSLLIPVILILILALTNIIYGYLFESRRRERLKQMFGQYVPEKHIDEMLHSKSNYALRGEDRDMSVLFADIRSFTTISEGMSASELVDMLNTFFTPMTEVIFKHRGTIDKYVGDLIMAFWGAPLKDKHHARHAIESALEMQKNVKKLQPILAERNWSSIQIGIGINSGIMSVGDMGSRYRRNYTVLGDAVNLASRVESLTKFYGVDIMVTEYTQKNQNKFIFRKLDRVRVKGKKHGIEIYEVVCLKSELTPELEQELALYHQALAYYFEQRFDDALRLMQQLAQQHQDRHIYKLYIERINEFKTLSIPMDWDGVYVHESK
jgi:adenylate cyclase